MSVCLIGLFLLLHLSSSSSQPSNLLTIHFSPPIPFPFLLPALITSFPLSSPNLQSPDSTFLPIAHFPFPHLSFFWLNPGRPEVPSTLWWQSPLYRTVSMLAGKKRHRSVKYTVKIAYDLWDSVLSKMILTRFECCSEMRQLHTHIGCFSSLPLAAREQCCHDSPRALFRSAIFWRSPWPSPQ